MVAFVDVYAFLYVNKCVYKQRDACSHILRKSAILRNAKKENKEEKQKI